MTSPFNWKTILVIGLTAILCLVFYYGYQVYLIVKQAIDGLKDLEGFQAAAAAAAAAKPDWEPPDRETEEEMAAYDQFETNNTPGARDTIPTNMPAYDSSSALAEFDDGAPVPWDFDNKDSDPQDVLWGYVDTRCSLYMWERARMRALFGSANNYEVDDNGGISYYSGYLNGMVFHDEATINAVKYAEFLIDFAAEEIIETAGSHLFMAGNTKLSAKAKAYLYAAEIKKLGTGKALTELQGLIDEAKAVTAALQTQADDIVKNGGKVTAEAQKGIDAARDVEVGLIKAQTTISDAAKAGKLTDEVLESVTKPIYNGKMKSILRAREAAEAARDAAKAGTTIGRISKGFGKVMSVFGMLDRALHKVAAVVGKPILKVARLTGKVLTKMGGKAAALIIGKTAAKKIGMILAKLAAKAYVMISVEASTPFPLNVILATIDIIFTIMCLAVIPQILSTMADLDEEPDSDNCNDHSQGCPISHPFNLRCGIIQKTSPAFYEFFTAIPYIGDCIGAFAPYLCMDDNGASVFRRSMRPPPYYFDTTLSLFFCEKPNVMDGSDGRSGDYIYKDPGVFKLYNNRNDPLTLTLPPNVNVPAGTLYNYFVPWVDFTHTEILNKMADYYMRMSKRNQTIDLDGFASFEFISNFKGLIASSQLSCDVQVELRQVRHSPLSSVPVDMNGQPQPAGSDFSIPIPSPWEIDDTTPMPWKLTISSSADTGYTFHDRRFYFTVDYKQVLTMREFQNLDLEGKTSEHITYMVQDALTRVNSATRMSAYRKMYIVTGCTHVNGTAADVTDVTADGNYLGDAPVSLGPPNQPYLPPKLDASSKTFSSIPQSTDCNASRSVVNHFGISNFGPSKGSKNDNKSTDGKAPIIYLTTDDEYFGITELTDVFIAPGVKVADKNNMARSATRVANIASLPASASDKEIRYVISENRLYIYTNYITADEKANNITPPRWRPYVPKPTWRSPEDVWYISTTKYWRSTMITPSLKSQFLGGLQGAATALGPVIGGFSGGLVVTTLDVTGASAAVSCTYQDMMNQTGTFVINGFIKTSQEHFFIDKGPAIRYAPGWTPANVYNLINAPSPTDTTIQRGINCPPRILNQSVCANRKAIRIMAQIFKNNSEKRRVKRLFSILPGYNPSTRTNACVYDVQHVNILEDGTDGDDIVSQTLSIPYMIPESSKTCEFQPVVDPATNKSQYFVMSPQTYINPIPPDITAFSPPTSTQTFDAMTDRVDIGFVPPRCTASTTIGGALQTAGTQAYNAATGDIKAKNAAFYKAVADRFNCGTASVQSSLVSQFNTRYLKDEGNPAAGSFVKITNVLGAKTPTPEGGAGGVPVCYYKANLEIQTDPRTQTKTSETRILKFTLDPSVDDNCGYTIATDDFPKNYFTTPVPLPDYAPFEMPPEMVGQGDLKRPATDGCDYDANPSYADCSGMPIIDRLVTQFNTAYTDRKILRVTKASTPKFSTSIATDTTRICEYEVDMMRQTGAGKKSVIERDTIRMNVSPNTSEKCMWDRASDNSDARFSGKSINKNTSSQALTKDYMWPTNFTTRVRSSINSYIRTFMTGNDIPAAMQKASKNVSDKLTTLENKLVTGQAIQNCPATTCMSAEIAAGFINRYNYDNTPAYPAGQFGSVQRSIVSVRRAGRSGLNMCHIEVVEKTQQFVNYLKEPKPNTPDADKMIRYDLKFYAFTIVNSKFDGTNGVCAFKVLEFPTDPKQRGSFDVSTNPYGIQAGIGTNIVMPSKFAFTQRVINGFNLDVLTAVRTAVAAFKINQPYLGDKIVGVKLNTISRCCNVKPNVIEYYSTISETVEVADIGLVDVSGTNAVITCTWPDTAWDPTTAAFPGAKWSPTSGTYEGGTTPLPLPTIQIFTPDRVEIVNQQVTLYGVQYPFPPYLYWWDPAGTSIDKSKEITKVMNANPNNANGYLKSVVSGTSWLIYDDLTSSPRSFIGSGSMVINMNAAS